MLKYYFECIHPVICNVFQPQYFEHHCKQGLENLFFKLLGFRFLMFSFGRFATYFFDFVGLVYKEVRTQNYFSGRTSYTPFSLSHCLFYNKNHKSRLKYEN